MGPAHRCSGGCPGSLGLWSHSAGRRGALDGRVAILFRIGSPGLVGRRETFQRRAGCWIVRHARRKSLRIRQIKPAWFAWLVAGECGRNGIAGLGDAGNVIGHRRWLAGFACGAVAERRTGRRLSSEGVGHGVTVALSGIGAAAPGLNVGGRADMKVDLSVARSERDTIGTAIFRFVNDPSAIGASLTLVGVDGALLRRPDRTPLELASASAGGFAGAGYVRQGKEHGSSLSRTLPMLATCFRPICTRRSNSVLPA